MYAVPWLCEALKLYLTVLAPVPPLEVGDDDKLVEICFPPD
jgi:hypothetical protein